VQDAIEAMRTSTRRFLVLLSSCALALPLACQGTRRADTASVTNRDPHGEPDVAKYIDRLQSPERLEDLQVDRVLSILAPPSDATIGDLGCGPGIFVLAFANAAPRGIVYASDIEPAQLDRVREHVRVTGLRNVVPVLASSDDPHFPPNRLDIVFVADTYHHLENRVEYMRRLTSVLKPGGRLVVLDYKSGPLPVGPPPDHKLAAGVRESELTEAGYVRVDRHETHPYHDFEVWRVVQPWEKSGR
jgi:SAM-dependent methyltransferase